MITKSALISDKKKWNRDVAHVFFKRHGKLPPTTLHYLKSNWTLSRVRSPQNYAVYSSYFDAKRCMLRRFGDKNPQSTSYKIFMIYDKDTEEKLFAVYKKE